MPSTIDAVYANGAFRPLDPATVRIADGRRVRITVEEADLPEALRLAARVYDGLTEDEIRDLEAISLDRSSFFSKPTRG